jgi:peptidoglycan/LPS O-acetylase OafA/YrhL
VNTAQISATSLSIPVARTSLSVENLEATKVDQIAAFDVLRFLLAFGVLLSHIGVLTWGPSGNLPVQIFFALSGWLIGSILYNTAPAELSRFYFDRATRIWIPYFSTVTILYLVSAVHEHVLSTRWHEFLIDDLTFTHNWFSLLPNA